MHFLYLPYVLHAQPISLDLAISVEEYKETKKPIILHVILYMKPEKITD
jgi:hypothetical protein